MILPLMHLYALKMIIARSLLTLTALAALIPSTLDAASAEMQAEYAQVRKIALKDPGVRAAYAKADAKLNAKILDIDPSLKPMVERGGTAPMAKSAASKKPGVKKPLQGAPTTSSSSYIVAKGDTLTSIASRYRVSAAELKSTNGIVDERKLQVGQTLRFPARSASMPATSESDDGLWARMKGGR